MKLIKILKKIENTTVFLLFSVMIVAVFLQVMNRNFIKLSIGWLEELARYSMIFLVLLGTEMGLRDGTQISVEALTQKLPEKIRTALKFATRVIVIYFSMMVFLNSMPLIKMQLKTGQLSPGLRVPMYIPYSAITIGFFVITAIQIATWLLDFKRIYFARKIAGLEAEKKI